MTITEQLKSKAEALRTVQLYVEELKKTRSSNKLEDELEEVSRFISGMIESYKQLVVELRSTTGGKKP